jgi:hypothetical protein
MVKISLYLHLERLSQWGSILEPLKGLKPFVQVLSSIDNANFLLVSAENLYEITDNVGEERNSQQHDYNSKDLFDPTDGVVISISHCSQGCESKIAGGNNLPF